MVYKNIKTYKKGYLNVGDRHKIYYELSGNPKGKPVFFIHGGPGGGFSQKHKRFFNPKVFNIITFDQRGSGKSKPFASLKNNTTQKLIKDIKKLLDHLKIKKTFLFGGSWGSTLSLVYAINYPKTIAGIVIGGIFLASKQENDYFIYESRNIFPEAWKKFTSIIPKKYIKKRLIEEYYYKMIKAKNKKTRKKFTRAWAEYEFSVSCLSPSDKKIKKWLKEIKYEAFSSIELHYLVHKCFLPKDYILKNAPKLNKIPVSIVHGRYDCVCSPLSAYALHERIKGSKLYFTLGGHSASDKETEKKLITEMDKLSRVRL
ncbi:MAG: prolyl aminopeptidase [Nanoarchaeota archaeon]|nr:prolyl aminopeptidase [Nanoarchaeota archaeon]